jgi:hypothetical protein
MWIFTEKSGILFKGMGGGGVLWWFFFSVQIFCEYPGNWMEVKHDFKLTEMSDIKQLVMIRELEVVLIKLKTK